jgi:hypothetical protein
MPTVSITRARFPANRAADVRNEFEGTVTDQFQDLKNNGQLRHAFFVMDAAGREAIGIAIYPDEATLAQVEGQRGRDAGPRIEDPVNAPPGLARGRAAAVRNSGAAMDRSEWYDLISEV